MTRTIMNYSIICIFCFLFGGCANPIEIEKRFHANGTLKSVEEFRNGKKNGKWTYYNTQGKLELVVSYNNGLFEECMEWWPNGLLKSIQKYDKQRKTTALIQWYSNGCQEWVSYYNQEIERLLVFDKLGLKSMDLVYEKGSLVSESCFSTKGNIITTGTYLNGRHENGTFLRDNKIYFFNKGKYIEAKEYDGSKGDVVDSPLDIGVGFNFPGFDKKKIIKLKSYRL